MREAASQNAIGGDNKSGRSGLVVLIIAVAHAVLYFAKSLYLPFDLAELFILGYLLIITDSALLVCLGIKLLGRVLSNIQTK
jgi:hypothetical protein